MGLFLAASCQQQHAPREAIADPLSQSLQLLVVQNAEWDAPTGILYLYERDSYSDDWRPAFSRVPVSVGQAGLAWGSGLWDFGAGKERVKVEGDKRSPAGIFSLGSVFGYADEEQAGVTMMPYIHVDQKTHCIEDDGSVYYNQIVQAERDMIDWKFADAMRRLDDLYRYGVFVNHNPTQEDSAGSCIFLHTWRGPDSGTAGCTAMDPDKLAEIIFWLNNSKRPLLVQLPKRVYLEKAAAWDLPKPYPGN